MIESLNSLVNGGPCLQNVLKAGYVDTNVKLQRKDVLTKLLAAWKEKLPLYACVPIFFSVRLRALPQDRL